jgi:hypothetical protein
MPGEGREGAALRERALKDARSLYPGYTLRRKIIEPMASSATI